MSKSALWLACCAFLAGCSRSAPDAAGAASSTVVSSSATDRSSLTPVVAQSAAVSASACPRTGSWALCSVEKRLEQSGFVVKRVDGLNHRRAGFSVAPVAYVLGHARLEVFIYPDESAAARDIAKIDTLTATPRGAPIPWETTPTVVRSGNLIAVFLTESPQSAERLTLALTAGAPQP